MFITAGQRFEDVDFAVVVTTHGRRTQDGTQLTVPSNPWGSSVGLRTGSQTVTFVSLLVSARTVPLPSVYITCVSKGMCHSPTTPSNPSLHTSRFQTEPHPRDPSSETRRGTSPGSGRGTEERSGDSEE